MAVYRDASMTDAKVAVVFIALNLWVFLAVSVKRWHDLGKSGWWLLIWLLPLVGPIWLIVELGFFRGTVGWNDYGPDPT